MRKRILILGLILVVIISAVAFSGCKPEEEEVELTTVQLAAAEQAELDIVYATDIHVMEADTEINDYQHPEFVAREFDCQKMNFISEAIFETFCDDVIASGKKIVLIGGDLTERGTELSHQRVAESLDRMKEHGIQTYVVPGNHDLYTTGAKAYRYTSEGPVLIPKATEEKFAEIYADYGYGPNSIRYEDTLSYVTNINSKYVLIGVDNVSRLVDRSLVEWIAEQAESAFFAGKTPILMMHKPLGERFTGLYETLGVSVSGQFTVSEGTLAYMKKSLAEAGLTYILTGHVHSNDVMLVPSGHKPGGVEKNLIDIMGNCTSFYDSTYREIRFTQNYVDLTLKHISVPKEEHLPSYLEAEDKNQILNNWREFSLEFGKRDFIENLDSTLQEIPAMFAEFALGIDLNSPEIPAGTAETIISYAQEVLLDYVLEVPIYEEDMTEEDSTSVETLAKAYGFTGSFPDTDYKNIFDIVTEIIFKAVCAGEAEYRQGAPELELIKYGLYGLIANLAEHDFFAFVSQYVEGLEVEDTQDVITAMYSTGVLDLMDANILDNILSLGLLSASDNPILSALSGKSASEILSILIPLLPSINALLKADLLDFMPLDPLAAEEALSGELNFGALIENYFYTVIGKGILFDPYTQTQDFVISRSDFTVYPK
jgi:predicted MPP superfamily phosphohydrolase